MPLKNPTTIKIYRTSTGLKDFEVQAELFGPLAIHEKIAGDVHAKYVIAHVQTGGVVVSLDSLSLARKVAAELSAIPEWPKLKSQHSKAVLKAIAPQRRAILGRYGL